MGDQVTVSPEKFLRTPCQGSSTTQHIAIPVEELSASLEAAKEKKPVIDSHVDNSQKPEEKGECRYCQEEDFVSKLESPCNCNGSLKYVHRSCIDQWYNSKGCIILCEICKKPYHPNYYSVPALPSEYADDTEISEEWTIPGTNTQIQPPLVLAERATNGLIASMNKDFSLRKPTGGMILGMALIIFIAVLIIKDAIHCAPSKEDTFSHFLYCVVMIISVPVYILSWVLQCQAHRKCERDGKRSQCIDPC